MKEGLEYIVESEKLYPVTILPSLKGYLLDVFAREQMMLVKDLLEMDAAKFAKRNRVPEKNISSLKREAEILFYGQA